MMRILYLSQYFPPEVGATQARAHDLAAGLVSAGHSVVVLCELPNHPSGIIPPTYRRKLLQRDTLDGIEVVRLWVRTSPTKTFASRMAFYISYMVMAVVAGVCVVRGRFDIVYATSPPLFVGAAGALLSFFRRTPLVLEVRDAWPEVAVRLGELRGRVPIALARWLERRCYRRARRVVTVTQGCRRYLLEQGLSAHDVVLVPNGANTVLFHPQPDAGAALRRALGLEGFFVAMYAGLHGIAQGLDSLLDAATRLRGASRVKFLLVGEGPTKAKLVSRATREGLDNVLFHEEVPREKMAAYFSMADVSVAPLREAALFQGVLPLKVFEAWACACPTLVAGGGEIAQIVDRAGGGLCVAPECPEALAGALLALDRDDAARRRMGERGCRYVREHFDRASQVHALERTLREVLSTH